MGSSPTTGTKHRGTRWVPLCLVMSYGTRSREQNAPVKRFARPGSESSPGAQHGVQAAVCGSLFNTPYMLYTKTVNKPKTLFCRCRLISSSDKVRSMPYKSPPVFRDFPPCLPIKLRKKRNLTEKMRKRKYIFDDD